MPNPKHLNLLINVAAAVTVVVVAGYIAYTTMYTPTEPPCSARYPAATRFALTNAAGHPLTPAELQARSGMADFGVLDNATVVRVEDGPAPEALEVQLRAVRHGADAGIPRNGVGFHWLPPGMGDVQAACISYSAWVPETFDYSSGGVLPGVFGGTNASPTAQVGSDTISVRPAWNSTGAPTIGIIAQDRDRGRISGSSTVTIARGQWMKIEQEVLLNTPGQPNGVARLWIDDKLVAENLHLEIRENSEARLQGVLFTVGYARIPAHPGVMRLSPLDIAWRK